MNFHNFVRIFETNNFFYRATAVFRLLFRYISTAFLQEFSNYILMSFNIFRLPIKFIVFKADPFEAFQNIIFIFLFITLLVCILDS